MSPKRSYAILVAVVVVIIVTFVVFYVKGSFSDERTPANSVSKNPYEDLKKDATFGKANEALKSRDYDLASSLYEKVPYENKDQYSLLQYNIAVTLLRTDKNLGLEAFKALIASSSINSSTKAFSINAIVRDYNSTRDNTVFTRLKSDPKIWSDFDKRLVAGFYSTTTNSNVQEAFLLELGNEKYKITDTSMRLAYRHSQFALFAKANNQKDYFDFYKKRALKTLEEADETLETTKSTENLTWMIPSILNRKAMVLETLRKLGEDTEDPEIYFKQSMNSYIVLGDNLFSFTRYNYANYLARTYGEERNPDIATILEPLVKNKNDVDVKDFLTFLHNAYKNKELTNINDIQELAKRYPPLKTLIDSK